MVEYDLIVVLKLFTKKYKMSLRASSTTMRGRIDELENTKVWRIRGEVDSTRQKIIEGDMHYSRQHIQQSLQYIYIFF